MMHDDTLTQRERDLLIEVARGLTNDEIARMMRRKPDTIDARVTVILDKLRARNRTHAVALAIWRGVI